MAVLIGMSPLPPLYDTGSGIGFSSGMMGLSMASRCSARISEIFLLL